MPKKNVTPATAASVNATADDLLGGFDDPYRPLELPLKKGGAALVVYLRPMSVSEVFMFGEIKDEEKAEATLDLIAAVTVDANGQPLFPGDKDTVRQKLRRLPAAAYNTLLTAIMGEMSVPTLGGPGGNASNATLGADSSTASLPS